MQRRHILTLVPAALLAGCGFRLRGVPEFAFGSLFIAAQPGSPLALELQRTLEGAGGPLKVLRDGEIIGYRVNVEWVVGNGEGGAALYLDRTGRVVIVQEWDA